MPEFVVHGLELLIKLLEICGASLLILGFVVATWKWVQRINREGQSSALRHYRRSLGRSVLIGLEVLVVATIIKTIIVEPSFDLRCEAGFQGLQKPFHGLRVVGHCDAQGVSDLVAVRESPYTNP